MWFVYVAVALVLLTIAGLYARRRITGALVQFGVGERPRRIIRWLIAWLLFGFPVLVIGSILVSRLAGATTIPRYDGLLAGWLLAVPFIWTVLVVLQALPWLLVLDVAHVIVRRRRARSACAP